MSEHKDANHSNHAANKQGSAVTRRKAFKGLAAATTAAATAAASEAAAQPGDIPHGKNPYGWGPNTGITLPPYYRPTPSVANANTTTTSR